MYSNDCNDDRPHTNLFLSANLAGVSVKIPIDGKNIWEALSDNKNSPRKNALLHLDYADGLQSFNHDFGYQSYIRDNYKYINGTSYNGAYDTWMDYVDKNEKHPSFQKYGQSIINSPAGQALAKYSLSNMSPSTIEDHRRKALITCNNVPIPAEKKFQCFPMEAPCLFNIVDDPCERRNLASLKPYTLKLLENEVNKFRLISPPVRNKPGDACSNPANFNNTWTWWYDELGIPDFEENRMPCKRKQDQVSFVGIESLVFIVKFNKKLLVSDVNGRNLWLIHHQF